MRLFHIVEFLGVFNAGIVYEGSAGVLCVSVAVEISLWLTLCVYPLPLPLPSIGVQVRIGDSVFILCVE